MTKTATVQARMKPELKRQTEAILDKLGINASAAISLYYTQIVRQGGIPLELKIPNAALKAAMREIKDPDFRKTARRFSSVKELMEDLNS